MKLTFMEIRAMRNRQGVAYNWFPSGVVYARWNKWKNEWEPYYFKHLYIGTS